MIKMPNLRAPFSAALAALSLGFSANFIPAHAQVMGAAPYAAAPDPVIERLQDRIDALESELRKATGRSEQLTFELNAERKKAEEDRTRLTKALDGLLVRVTALEALARGETEELSYVPTQPVETYMNVNGGAPTPELAQGPAATPATDNGLASRVEVAELPTDQTELMKQSREFLLSGNYPAAQQALNAYLTQHPKSPQADGAQYLLGEALLYQGNYSEAATAYGKLLSDHPDSDRGPEALVKLSRSMRLMGKKDEGCRALSLLNDRYPNASQTAKTLAATEKSAGGC